MAKNKLTDESAQAVQERKFLVPFPQLFPKLEISGLLIKGADLCIVENPCVPADSPKNVTTNSLLLIQSLTDKHEQLTQILYMICIIYFTLTIS